MRVDKGPVTVILGRLDRVLAIGVSTILRRDRGVRLLGYDFDDAALEAALTRCIPHVAILNEMAEPFLVEQLQSASPETQLLVLAHDPPLSQGLRLLAAGASCVGLRAAELDLAATVRTSAQGHRFFVSAEGERLSRSYPADAEPLTQREREVLARLARGATYSEIALALQIGLRTAETHGANVRRKLRANDNRELLGIPIPAIWRGA